MKTVHKEYEGIYINGYEDALGDMQRWQQARRKRKWERQARRQYFLKQKVLGIVLLIFTILITWLLEGDATIALITAPLGFALIFSKQTLIVNDYYFERESGRK